MSKYGTYFSVANDWSDILPLLRTPPHYGGLIYSETESEYIIVPVSYFHNLFCHGDEKSNTESWFWEDL